MGRARRRARGARHALRRSSGASACRRRWASPASAPRSPRSAPRRALPAPCWRRRRVLALALLPGPRRPRRRAGPRRGAAARQRAARARRRRVDRRPRRARARAARRDARGSSRADRTRLLAAAIGRFSTLALVSVAVLLAGGIAAVAARAGRRRRPLGHRRSAARSRSRPRSWSSCSALGALNRRRTLPAAARAPRPRAPRRAAPACCCGARCAPRSRSASPRWPSPARSPATRPRPRRPPGPFSGSADLGPARAELTVEPARAGANEIHVYLFDRSDGRQYDAPKELRFEASLPERGIEPIRLEARKAGPGHYVVGAAALAPPGDWRLELVARIIGLRRAPHHLHGPDRMKEAPTVRRSILAAAVAAALLAPRRRRRPTSRSSRTRAPAGGFTRLDVRVPNERDDAGTTKVDVQLPPGLHRRVLRARPGLEGEGHPREGSTSRSTPARASRSTSRSRASPGPATASRASIAPGAVPGLRPVAEDARRARPATSSPSRRCRPTTTARSCAGSARRTPTSPRRS